MSRRKDKLYEKTLQINGKRMHFYGTTSAQATLKRDAYKKMMQECPLYKEKVTLSEWLTAWLSSVKSDISPSTYENYSILMNKHIMRAQIGNLMIQDLKPSMFRTYWQQMLDTGLSPRTVIYVHTIVSQALKQAVLDGLIPVNPLSLVHRPRCVKREIKALSKDQIKLLLSHLKNKILNRIARFALATGMRREEILGLRWSDVNFERNTVSVNQTVIRCGKDTVISPTTKTAASHRTISIDPHTVDLLHAQHAYDLRQKIKSAAYHDYDLVFCTESGSPYTPDYPSRAIKNVLKQIGLGEFSFHSFRHTHATMLLQAGVHFKIVQYRLGHSSFQMTMDTYSHVTPEMEGEVVSVLEKIL